jgi:hypothetical protein
VRADDRREAAVRRAGWAIGDEESRQRVLFEHGQPAARRRGRPPDPGRPRPAADFLHNALLLGD